MQQCTPKHNTGLLMHDLRKPKENKLCKLKPNNMKKAKNSSILDL